MGVHGWAHDMLWMGMGGHKSCYGWAWVGIGRCWWLWSRYGYKFEGKCWALPPSPSLCSRSLCDESATFRIFCDLHCLIGFSKLTLKLVKLADDHDSLKFWSWMPDSFADSMAWQPPVAKIRWWSSREDSSTFKWVLTRCYAHEANGQMLSSKGRAASHGSQATWRWSVQS